MRQFNNDILVGVWVGPDGKDSDDYIVQVSFRTQCGKKRNFLSIKRKIREINSLVTFRYSKNVHLTEKMLIFP